jgi:hypothetical protein
MEGTSILTNGVAFREEASAEDLGRCDAAQGLQTCIAACR